MSVHGPAGPVPGTRTDAPCPCGSGRRFAECCGRSAAAINRPPPQRPPPSPDIAAPALDGIRRRLDEEARLRRKIDGLWEPKRATPAPDMAARRRAAAALVRTAIRLRQAGRLEESIAPLRQAIAANPHDHSMHHDLGVTFVRCQRHDEAVPCLQQAAALKPDHAPSHFTLGMAFQALGRDADAVAAYARAVALAPKLAEAHARMGFLLHGMQRFAESRECYRRGAAAAPGKTVGRLCEAKLLAADERFAEANAVLRRILAREPRDLEALTLLARNLSILGDLEAAEALYEQALALDPVLIGAVTGLIMIRKMAEKDRPLIARIERHLREDRLGPPHRVGLHLALGKALDDLAEYESAIRHYDAANDIRAQLASFDRSALDRLVETAETQCARDFLASRAGFGSDDETPIFVIGMPRSGTTLVEQIASSHPLVCGAGELPFWMERSGIFDRLGYQGLEREAIDRLADEYRAALRRAAPAAARITDKMPFNFLWLGLIHLVFPKARFIHCRRHPVDTCLSIYFSPFEAKARFASTREDLVFYYRGYERLMAHWRAIMPPDRFIEIDYEALTADPEPHIRRLIAFCGLEWDEACLHPERNPHAVQTVSLWQARQPIYRSSVARWRRYEPWLGALRELMPPDPIA
jgi:tetratricopeptide (TPR) repeat protein